MFIIFFSESVRATSAEGANLVEIVNSKLAIHLTQAKDRLASRAKSSDRSNAVRAKLDVDYDAKEPESR